MTPMTVDIDDNDDVFVDDVDDANDDSSDNYCCFDFSVEFDFSFIDDAALLFQCVVRAFEPRFELA